MAAKAIVSVDALTRHPALSGPRTPPAGTVAQTAQGTHPEPHEGPMAVDQLETTVDARPIA